MWLCTVGKISVETVKERIFGMGIVKTYTIIHIAFKGVDFMFLSSLGFDKLKKACSDL